MHDDDYWRLGTPRISSETFEMNDSGDIFHVGDTVILKGGTKPLRIDSFYQTTDYEGTMAKMTYLHRYQTIKRSDINRLLPYNDDLQSIEPEEQTMSKYGNQSHDQIFEALVDELYYTVTVRFDDTSRAYNYRVAKDLELQEGDQVVVSVRNTDLNMATVIGVDKNKNPKAVAWVVQKVDTSAHDKRTEEWTTLYEGVKTAEMRKKKDLLASGYQSELLQYAPDAAAILTSMTSGRQLTDKTQDEAEGVVE